MDHVHGVHGAWTMEIQGPLISLPVTDQSDELWSLSCGPLDPDLWTLNPAPVGAPKYLIISRPCCLPTTSPNMTAVRQAFDLSTLTTPKGGSITIR